MSSSFHRGDRALLGLQPEPSHLSRRALVGGFTVICLGGVVWGGRRYRASLRTPEERRRARFVRDYLTRNSTYSHVITGVDVRGSSLNVHTNLGETPAHPPPVIHDQPHATSSSGSGGDVKQLAGMIYDTLWNHIAMEHPEAGISYVYIFDHQGNLIFGGQA